MLESSSAYSGKAHKPPPQQADVLVNIFSYL